MPAAVAIPAAAAVIGGALSAKGAKDAAQTQADAVNAANAQGGVPDWARPFVDDAMGKAQTVANTPYEAYKGALTAPKNQYETAAASGIVDWAKGTPQSNQAASAYADMAGGTGAKSAFESMVKNPNQFTAGAAPTSTAYADNHLGTLNQSKAQDTTASLANNSYIGATSQGVAGAPQIGGLLGNNPYANKSVAPISGAPQVSTGKNALLGMNNPHLQQAIDYAQGDVTRNYERSTAPQQAQRMAASGSFGNTGLMSQDSEERRNFAGELGRVSSGMRMQDYGLQAQLGEQDLSRRLGADQFNANNSMATQTFNAGLLGNDLNRNLNAWQQQQGMGMDAAKFDANNIFGAQQFNSNLGQADLARNAGLLQSQGQYNASAQTGANQWNAGNNTQNNQWNAGAGNGMSLANAGIQNSTNQFNVNNLNKASDFNANAASQMNQFNSAQTANMFGQGAAGLANQQNQGLQGLLGIDGRQLQGQQALGLLGSNERGIDQQGLAAQYDQWLRQQNDPLQKSQGYNAALGTLVNKTNPIIQDQQVSPSMQGLGAGMALWGALKPSNTTGNNVANMGKTVDNTEYQNMYKGYFGGNG